MPNKTIRIGSLWKKQKGNLKFMTGSIEVIAGQRMGVGVFKNDRKQSAKSPDYQIVLLQPQENRQSVATEPVKEEKPQDTEEW